MNEKVVDGRAEARVRAPGTGKQGILVPGPQFLAGETIPRPGDRFEAGRGDFLPAAFASTIGTARETAKCVVNFSQQLTS